MSTTPSNAVPDADQQLKALGAVLRVQRKGLNISVTTAAESASMSRITWHRIEKGEPSVAAGAYAKALQVLGLTLSATTAAASSLVASAGMIPALVPLDHYPQLQQLAWHVKSNTQLTAREAFDIYERNAKHLEREKLTEPERQLIDALQQGFAFSTGESHGR